MVGAVASGAHMTLADGGERMAEAVGEFRDCIAEKAEHTCGAMGEKAEDALGYWQDTGR